jgi:hypothetical protein
MLQRQRRERQENDAPCRRQSCHAHICLVIRLLSHAHCHLPIGQLPHCYTYRLSLYASTHGHVYWVIAYCHTALTATLHLVSPLYFHTSHGYCLYCYHGYALRFAMGYRHCYWLPICHTMSTCSSYNDTCSHCGYRCITFISG